LKPVRQREIFGLEKLGVAFKDYIALMLEGMTLEDIRVLVDMYRTFQRKRIAFGNRVSALQRGSDEGDPAPHAGFMAMFYAMESAVDRRMGQVVTEHPVYERWLKNVRGMGPTLAAQLLAMTGPDEAMAARETVSTLWAFAGMAVKNGKGQRPVAGEKLPYNAKLRVLLYNIGGSFLRSGSPFRKVYDDSRAHYLANRPDWTDGHRHMAAMRRMMKVFLSLYWEVYRKMMGLGVRPSYVEEKLGHTHLYKPDDFAAWDWPGKEVKADEKVADDPGGRMRARVAGRARVGAGRVRAADAGKQHKRDS